MKHQRGARLRRNPFWKWMSENRIRSNAGAKLLGYRSVSAMYKALRFEVLPGPSQLSKMATILKVTEGKLYELWRTEKMRRAA